MADGTTFEKRGIPSATIITLPFRTAADAMAARHGYPGYRYAAMPHPIGNLGHEQICERTLGVLPDVLAILGLA